MRQVKTSLFAAVLAVIGSNALAVQTQIMVQGYLTNASGTPYTTTQAAEFRLYQGGSANTGGSGALYYDETASVTPSASGVFNYLLGSGTPTVPYLVVNGQTIPNVISSTTFNTSQAVYLEISVGGTVLLPRLLMAGTPYSILSGTAENLKPTGQITVNTLTASSGTFTASGPNQASIQASSGIVVLSGQVTAPAFSGAYYGDGSHLVNVGASNVAAANVAAGTFGPGVALPSTQVAPGPITLTSGTFTASGSNQASIQTSSGIIAGGPVTAPAFNGVYYGDGSNLAGVTASGVWAEDILPGTLGNGVLLPMEQLVPGPVTATSGTFTTSGSSPFQASAGGAGLYIDGSNNVGIKTRTPHADAEIGPVANATLRVGGLYSGPTSGYSGNGQETSRHQLVFPSWSTVANNTIGSKIVSINKTAYGSAPWYLSQSSELHFFILMSGALDPDDTVDALDLTAGGLMSLNGFYSPKGITASSGTFTASGVGQASIQTSSGIVVQAGMVTAPGFSGTYYGDGSNLTGVSATNVPATNVTPGTFGAGVLLPAAQIAAGPVTATSGTFTANGAGQPSIQTSSGILVQAGQVTAPAFSGTYYGNGSKLTGVSVPASGVTPGTLSAGVLLPAAQIAAGPITATSGTFTANGAGQPSIQTSSGIVVQAGQVTAPAFTGAFFGSGAGLTGVGGAAPIGSITAYAGQSEPFGWLECNGRSLPQAGTYSASWGQFNAAAVFAVIGTVWGSGGAGSFNIPDLRGIFPRGWNHGKTTGLNDPDASSRVAQYASGATGDSIGSYQVDQLVSHTHSFPVYSSSVNNGGALVQQAYTNVSNAATVTASATGGNETRGKNASVMYILRVQ